MTDNILTENIKRIISEKGYKQKSVAQKGGYNPKQFKATPHNSIIVNSEIKYC